MTPPEITATAPTLAELAGRGRVHFIGLGGVGMSGLARILLARGVAVSGSDSKDSAVLEDLRGRGAVAFVGHDASHLDGVGAVVVSSAIRATNPELARARAEGMPVLHRSQALAALMEGRRAVAVAGTHGKTTTTSMLTVALREAGADPSFAIGGELTGVEATRASAGEGSTDIFVAEADESDGSFLRYHPTVAVITNVEPDHLDHYGTAEAVAAAFDAFADRIEPGGALVACLDDPGAAAVATGVAARRPDVRVLGYALDDAPAGCDLVPMVRLAGISTAGGGVAVRFVPDADRLLGVAVQDLRLQVPGVHNARNAAAAWLAGLHLLGAGAGEALARGLEHFGGTRRRFELVGRAPEGAGPGGAVEVRDDYAHHPTEVAAALTAARETGPARLVVAFQPHLFSRTRIFAKEFAAALGLADEVVVLDVYAAREDPEPGVTGELIAGQVPLPPGRVRFVAGPAEALDALGQLVRPGDLVMTMGAGDITGVGPKLLARLRAEGAAR